MVHRSHPRAAKRFTVATPIKVPDLDLKRPQAHHRIELHRNIVSAATVFQTVVCADFLVRVQVDRRLNPETERAVNLLSDTKRERFRISNAVKQERRLRIKNRLGIAQIETRIVKPGARKMAKLPLEADTAAD